MDTLYMPPARMHRFRLAAILSIAGALSMLGATALPAKVIYVQAGAAGVVDGTSWVNAFTSLQNALAAAVAGDEIWVAAGTYHPDSGAAVARGDRSAAFVLKRGVALYGGFRGTETFREQRNVFRYESVLSGDLLDNDINVVDIDGQDRSENSYNVITADGTDSTTILDGFTVRGGNADGPTAASGAGLNVSNGTMVVRRCIFRANAARNAGGGIAGNKATLSIMFSTFTDNHAGVGGGLLLNGRFTGRTSLVANSAFWRNSAMVAGGGIATNGYVSPVIAGCVIAQNTVSGDGRSGGGVAISLDSAASVVNCTIVQNAATGPGSAAGGLFLAAGKVSNCILWENAASRDAQVLYDDQTTDSGRIVRNSTVQGGFTGPQAQILTVDPMLADMTNPPGEDGRFGTPDDGLRLVGTSTGIDEGYIPAVGIHSDMLGNPRMANVIPDIGAYEAPRVGGVDHAGTLTELRGGGLIVVFRHALTDMRQRDSSAWMDDRYNCDLQRNLNADGRAQATFIGNEFRALGIPYSPVISSPMCRTRETALRAFGGYLEMDAWMNDPSRFLSERRSMLGTHPSPGVNMVIVTHQLAIMSVTTFQENEISEGDCIILRPLGNSSYQEIDHITPDVLERFLASAASDVERPSTAGSTSDITCVPNPAQRTAEIRYRTSRPGHVSLRLVDARGVEVVSLSDGRCDAGDHVATADVAGLATGLYFVRLATPDAVQTTRMIVVR